MNKFLGFVLSLLMVCTMSVTAFAADFSADAESELNDITTDIVTVVNELYSQKLGSISDSDIDYSQAFKVFVDTNVFKLPTNKMNDIQQELNQGNYVYVLPIKTANGTVVVNIQKGLPLSDAAQIILTEEEQKEVLRNVGKWKVSNTSYYSVGDTRYNYTATLKNQVGEIPEETILVGSLPIFRDVVALVANADGMVDVIVPVTETSLTINNILSRSSNTNIYGYQDIKNIANSLPDENSEEAGTSANINAISKPNTSVWFFSIVTAMLIVIGFVFCHNIHKKRTNKGE